MSSSCWHGVTSVVMGNCGMTFAPVRPGQAEVLARAMESVEDIPASCILDGLAVGLGGLRRVPRRRRRAARRASTPAATSATSRCALYVAGDAACEPDFRLSDDQLAEMARLVEQSIEAGALGYSISRSLIHRVPDGRSVPGTWSDPSEFFAVAEPLGRLGRGVLESAPRYNLRTTPDVRVDEELGLDGRAQPRASAARSASTSCRSARSATTTAGCSTLCERGQPHRRPAAPPDHAPQHRRAVQPRRQHADRRPARLRSRAGRRLRRAPGRRSATPRSGAALDRRRGRSPIGPVRAHVPHDAPSAGARYDYARRRLASAPRPARAGVGPVEAVPRRRSTPPTAPRS